MPIKNNSLLRKVTAVILSAAIAALATGCQISLNLTVGTDSSSSSEAASSAPDKDTTSSAVTTTQPVETTVTTTEASLPAETTSSTENPTPEKLTLTEQDTDALKSFLKQFSMITLKGEMAYDNEKQVGQEYNVILNIIGSYLIWNYELYPGTPDINWYFGENGETDPEGKYPIFSKSSEKTVDWILSNILNISDADIAKLKADGESKDLFYIRDGYYYTAVGGIGWFAPHIIINKTFSDGKYIYCSYDYYEGDEIVDKNLETEADIIANCTPKKYIAVMEYKTIDSAKLWTIYKLSKDDEIAPAN